MQKTLTGMETGLLCAAKRFGRYRLMDEQGVRKPAVQKSEALERIEAAWREFVPVWPHWTSGYAGGAGPFDLGFDHEFSNLEKARGIARALEPSAREVEAFCVGLFALREGADFSAKAGLFMSALVEESPAKRFMLNVEALDADIDYLGFRNRKKIRIIGDAGKNFGAFMRGGSIYVQGNAGLNAGLCLINGRIRIAGDAGYNLGGGFGFTNHRTRDPGTGLAQHHFYHMVGGRITVDGNTGEMAGNMMKGGEIHLNGEYGATGNVYGGRIFHRGKLVAGKR